MIEFFSGKLSLFDKKMVYSKLEENGIKCPLVFARFEDVDKKTQYFIKPIKGFGSVGIEERTGDNLRYIDWSLKLMPKTLCIDDLDKICASNTLFARKIESEVSKDLIYALSNKIGISNSNK